MLSSQLVNSIYDEMQQAQDNKHLLMPEQFAQAHKGEGFLIDKFAFTSNPYFEQFTKVSTSYRIKANVSASHAIENILINGETYIDCGVAIGIFTHLFILRKMEEMQGKIEGRKRFDTLFGSSNENTPESRRLIISQFGLLMGTNYVPSFGILPVDPLSYLVKIQQVTKNNFEKDIKVGYHVVYIGDSNYGRIHPTGSSGRYNCIVSCANPLKVRTFGMRGELFEKDLYNDHCRFYSQEPSEESIIRLKGFYSSEEFRRLHTTQPQIQGYCPIIFALDEVKLKFLLNGDLKEVITKIDTHIQEAQLRCVNEALSSALQVSTTPTKSKSDEKSTMTEKKDSLKNDTIKSTPSITNGLNVATNKSAVTPKQSSADFGGLSGLSGLRGAFLHPQAKMDVKNKTSLHQ